MKLIIMKASGRVSSGVGVEMALVALLVLVGAISTTADGDVALANVTRFATGDLFSLVGSDCGPTRCMEVSHGTALSALQGESGCVCQCRKGSPTYREDQGSCVDHIEECVMASYGRETTKPQIPFVFLPLKGQIIYPSKEIIFTDVDDAVCAVTSAQYLTGSGWVTLRDLLDNDVPFSLYRDEGSTFLQWRGSPPLHARLEGHLVAVHVICSAMTPVRLVASCAAFRVAGATHNSMDVRFIPFQAGETTDPEDQNQGLTVLEALAIGVCVLMLIFVYAAGIIFYIHYKQRQKKNDKDPESNTTCSESGSTLGTRIDLDNVMLKTNPLLKMDNYGVDFNVHDSGLSDLSERTEDTLDSSSISHTSSKFQQLNSTVISAMVHTRRMKKPNRPSIRMTTPPDRVTERLQRRSASPDIERAPHSELSIVDCMENNNLIREPSPPSIGEPAIRRKLYFNPVFFETDLLKNPPPAAIEFLVKIREVMSIAKDRMTNKRYIPSLTDIPEEESYHTVDLGWDIACARRGRRFSAIGLKRENSRRSAAHCGGCPGCDSQEPIQRPALTRSNSCKSCVSEDYKQRIVRKWLEEVPPLDITRPVKSVAKVSGTPRIIVSPIPKDENQNESPMIVKNKELTVNEPASYISRLTNESKEHYTISKQNTGKDSETSSDESSPKETRSQLILTMKDIMSLREPKIVNHIKKPLKDKETSKAPASPASRSKLKKLESLGLTKCQISAPIISYLSDGETSSVMSMHSLERVRLSANRSPFNERPLSPNSKLHIGEQTKSPINKKKRTKRPMSPENNLRMDDRPMSPTNKYHIGERAKSPVMGSHIGERPMSPDLVIERAISPVIKHHVRPRSPKDKCRAVNRTKSPGKKSSALSQTQSKPISEQSINITNWHHVIERAKSPELNSNKRERAVSPVNNKERRIPSNHASRRIRKKLPPPPPPPVSAPKFQILEHQSKIDPATESSAESVKSDEAPIPPEVKVKMEAVIRELNDCSRSNTDLTEESEKATFSESMPPKIIIPVAAPPDGHYFSDDNMISDIKRKPIYLESETFVDFDSMERQILKNRRFSLACGPELIKRGAIKPYDLKTAKDTITRSWRDVRRAVECYNFISPRDSSVTDSRKSSISEIFIDSEPLYDNIAKPGPLTIQIRGSPVETRRNVRDEFDADTLDRNPKRESKKRIEKILLKSGGSFKHKPVTQETASTKQSPEPDLNTNIGSLREIYESKTKEEDKRLLYYERRSSLPYIGEEIAALVKSVKTSDIIRQLETQKDPKPPIPPKFRRGSELSPKFTMSIRDSPSEKRRTPEDRERYTQNVVNRRSGRRSNRTRSRRTDLRKIYRTEDSGYLSTDSNESKRRASYLMQLKPKMFDHTAIVTTPTVVRTPILPHIESDTDDMESICDGRSESGGESIETDSVFFGNFDESKQMLADLGVMSYDDRRGKYQRQHEQIDSGFMGETNIILSGDSDSEHRSVISIVTGRDGRASAASITQLDDGPYVHSNC